MSDRPAVRLRLFAALELPDWVRTVLASWAARHLRERSELRPLTVDSLHVTLCFLGWRDEGQAEAIAALMPYEIAAVMIISTRIAKIHTRSCVCTIGLATASRMNVISATPVTP